MNDSLLVRRFERLRDLSRDRERFIDRNRASRDPLGKILALDEFHHQPGDVPAFLEAVDVRDVRMIQRGQRLRFARESREAVRIMREGIWQDLDRDVAVQFRIAGTVHLSHATFADRRGDVVDAEPRAGGKGQSLWIIGARLGSRC